jgi:Protein of unknown function (DUF1641)
MASSNGVNGAQHAAEVGVSPALVARLNEPATVAALNRLLDHAELLAFSAASLDGLLRRGDTIADNVAASVQDLRQSMPNTKGLDQIDGAQLMQLVQHLPRLIEVTNQLAALTEKPEFQATLQLLSNPQLLDSLNKLLGNAELLAFLIGSLDSLLQRGDTIADNLRASLHDMGAAVPEGGTQLLALIEAVHQQRAYLPRLVYTLPQFTSLVERLGPMVASAEVNALFNSGIFHPDTVALVGKAGDAFADTYADQHGKDQKLGLIGLIKAINDPDVQRVLALLVNFSRRFGKTI